MRAYLSNVGTPASVSERSGTRNRFTAGEAMCALEMVSNMAGDAGGVAGGKARTGDTVELPPMAEEGPPTAATRLGTGAVVAAAALRCGARRDVDSTAVAAAAAPMNAAVSMMFKCDGVSGYSGAQSGMKREGSVRNG